MSASHHSAPTDRWAGSPQSPSAMLGRDRGLLSGAPEMLCHSGNWREADLALDAGIGRNGRTVLRSANVRRSGALPGRALTAIPYLTPNGPDGGKRRERRAREMSHMEDKDVDRRVAMLLKRYSEPAILLNRPYPPQPAPSGRSYFGGLPTLPDGFEWPRTTGGVPLHFLCQVDCADITWQNPLPNRGVLFFFGRDDAQQIWGEGALEDDCRVLYAAESRVLGKAMEPPADLPPIGWSYPRSSFCDISLESDSPQRLHVNWPAQPLRMATFPDTSGLPPAIADTQQSYYRLICKTTIDEIIPYLNPSLITRSLLEREPADRPAWDRYDEVLPLARAQAFEEATGQKTFEDRLLVGMYDGARRMFDDKSFPQFWILIHFFARAVLRRHRGTSVFEDPALTPEQLTARASADDLLDEEARSWFDRSCIVPLSTVTSDDERREFRAWAAGIQRYPSETSPSYDTLKWLQLAALWAIRLWAGDPHLAAKLPSSTYECVAAEFHLSRVQRSHERDWYTFEFSQMLGHAPAAQDAKPADDPLVCLLNIATDRGLGWSFGDGAACSFWITQTDLAARDFSRVRGTIEGY